MREWIAAAEPEVRAFRYGMSVVCRVADAFGDLSWLGSAAAGGRIVVSDLVLTRPLSEEMKRNVDLYVGCVAGASPREEYLGLMHEAGFADVEVVAENGYSVAEPRLEPGSAEAEAFHSVVSAKIRARKP